MTFIGNFSTTIEIEIGLPDGAEAAERELVVFGEVHSDGDDLCVKKVTGVIEHVLGQFDELGLMVGIPVDDGILRLVKAEEILLEAAHEACYTEGEIENGTYADSDGFELKVLGVVKVPGKFEWLVVVGLMGEVRLSERSMFHSDIGERAVYELVGKSSGPYGKTLVDTDECYARIV